MVITAPFRKCVPWLGLLLVAAFIRLPLLLGIGTLWNDEAFSRHFALLPLGKALGYMTMDVHPPLHLALLHFWIKLFGASAIALRAMSFAFALVGLVAFLKLVRVLFGKKDALLAGALFALSPLMVYYGVDARMYAMIFCLASLSGWLFWRVIEGDEKKRNAWMWVSLALAMTHVTGALVLVGQALFLIVSRERWPMLRTLFWRFTLIAAVFCFWLVPAATYRLQSIHKEWQFRSGQDDLSAPQALVYWIWLGKNRVQLALAMVVSGLLVVAGLLRRSDHKPFFHLPKESVFLLCWFGAAFLPFLLFPNASPRYLMAATPPFFILLAHGFVKATQGTWFALLLGIGLIVFFSAPGLGTQYAVRSYHWDSTAAWIVQRRSPNDRIVFAWYADRYAFEALEDPKLSALANEAWGLYPFNDDLDEDARYAAHAGTLAITEKDLDRLDSLFADAARVFFVPNFYLTMKNTPADVAVAAWLNARGWFLADRLPPEGRTPGVWLLVRKEN